MKPNKTLDERRGARSAVCSEADVTGVLLVLSAQGVKVPDLQDELSEKGYIVRVAGVPQKIYDATVWSAAGPGGFRW